MPQEANELSGEGLDAGEGTDEDQRSWVDLLHEFQSDSSTDGAPHHDDVLLLEAQLVDNVVVDVLAVLLDDLRGSLPLVNAVSRIFHGDDVDLGGRISTW